VTEKTGSRYGAIEKSEMITNSRNARDLADIRLFPAGMCLRFPETLYFASKSISSGTYFAALPASTCAS